MKSSPWGAVQNKKTIARGVHFVSTASHGGMMISLALARKRLSVLAQTIGENYGGYLCYEEDCAVAVPMLEVPEWREAGNAYDTEEHLIRTCASYYLPYLLAYLKSQGKELPDYAKEAAGRYLEYHTVG